MRSFRHATVIVSGAMLAAAGPPALVRAEDVADLARQAAERDARALAWLLQQNVLPAAAAAPDPDGQREAQIAQHAKQLEQMFRVILASELELIRRSCGGLDQAARRKILEDGRRAVEAAARGFSERQFNGQMSGDAYDPRHEIRTRLAAAVAAVAAPADTAAYRAATEQRQARRREAARVAIVARIDRQLDLSAGQREAIEADLARLWRPDWATVLDGRGIVIGRYPLAPDKSAAAIRPHLKPSQLAEWEKWCQAAGSRAFQHHVNLRFDGQGIPAVDPWWER